MRRNESLAFIFSVVLALVLTINPTVRAEDAAAARAEKPAAPPVHRPIEKGDRILIISVDGLRPDMLLRCKAPNMHALMDSGSFSFWARTVPHAITLPSHVSMLTGVIPRKHEVEWNKDLPLAKPVYSKFPTLFDVAHNAGYTTAIVAGKKKFETLNVPGTLDWKWITDSEKSEDADVAEHAVQIILEHKPQVMFVHLPSTDNVGHKIGWGTPEQEATVEAADGAVRRLLGALDVAKVRESTFVILTADHGGAGKTHLPDDARARHIPWIITGPGIRQHLDLTTYPSLVINTEDTFATSSYLMAIPCGVDLDGKPVMEILQDRGELLKPGPAADAR